jgi:hypothetical protein
MKEAAMCFPGRLCFDPGCSMVVKVGSCGFKVELGFWIVIPAFAGMTILK